MHKILKNKFVVAGLAALVTFIVFLPSLQNEFINWDDGKYVYQNPDIGSLDIELLKYAFLDFHVYNWHPLTWLSHALDYAIWGLNPLGHHLTNNILHALNALMVVLLVIGVMEVYKRTAENNGLTQPFLNERTIKIAGAVTGLLFGLHPLHVESVAWVSERKDLLCALFFLLTIITYTQYVSEINASGSTNFTSRLFNRKYLFAIVFFILSLLSKPMAVTLPFVLLILDWYPFRRIRSLKAFWSISIEKLPFLVLALISSIVTILAQKMGGAIQSTEVIPLVSRAIVAAGSLLAYIMKIIMPLNLVPYYPYPNPENIYFFSLEYAIPVLAVFAITAACIALIRQQKLWMSVWSYYVITLIPVLGFVQVGGQSMADRYSYLPSLGPLLVIGLISAMSYEKVSALYRRGMLRMGIFVIGMAMLVSLSYATIRQIGIWKNDIVFWNYVIDNTPSNLPHAHINLGSAYLIKGELDMAIEHYQSALKMNPGYGMTQMVHYNLGLAYNSKGELDMAIEHFQAALALNPDYLEAHYNLGLAYTSTGALDRAIEQYQAAVRLNPNYADAHLNLGLVYQKNGSIDKARTEFEAVLRIKPDDYWALQMLSSTLSK